MSRSSTKFNRRLTNLNSYTNFTKKDNTMKKMMPLVFALAVLITPCGAFAQHTDVTVETVTTETVGTISEVSPDTLVVRSETSTAPTKYTYTKSTTYVDDMGNPVSMETVKSGLPVTVYYTQEGDQMIADKVVVRKTSTTTQKPIMQEKRTKTTTTTTETK